MIWQRKRSPLSGKVIAYNKNKKQLVMSEDLLEWTVFGASISAWHISRIGGLFVETINRAYTYIKYSDDDGVSWKTVTPPGLNRCSSMCYDGKLYYVLDIHGNIVSTSDMITWKKISTNLPPLKGSGYSDIYTEIGYSKRYNLFLCLNDNRSYSGYFTRDINSGIWTACPRGDSLVCDDKDLVYINKEASCVYMYNPDKNIFEVIVSGSIELGYYGLLLYNGYLYIPNYNRYIGHSDWKAKLQIGSTWEIWQIPYIDSHFNTIPIVPIGVNNKVYLCAANTYGKVTLYEYDIPTDSFKMTNNGYVPDFISYIE